MTMADFAEPKDIEEAWRPLNPVETSRASYWIGAASRKIRRQWKDIDARISADDPTADDVKDIVIALVIGILPGLENEGKKSLSVQAGNMTRSFTVEERRNEDRLHFEKWMIEIIEGSAEKAALPKIESPEPYGLNRIFPQWKDTY